MLKSILNDTRLNNKFNFCILLLPPNSYPPFQFDYLASHVIHIPFQSSLYYSNSRLKKKLVTQYSKEYQWLFPVNEAIIYKTNNGYIFYNSKKVKITHTDYLFKDNNNDICTHMLLYLDQSLISNDSLKDQQLLEELQPTDLCSFKDMLKNDDVTDKIDKLVLQFCDTSVQCDSLKSLHDCMESILDDGYKLLQNLNTSKDLDALFGSFESYIMDSTYDVAFFKITQLLLPQDKKLTKALEDMEHLDFSQIGLPTSITDERNRVHCAISVFERIGSFRTPAEKLDCLLNTISELTKDDNFSSFLDSDSLIPLLLITLIRSKVPHLTANLVYMKEYTFERNIITGKYGYALSTFEGVLDYILDAHLELSQISKRNIEYWSALKTGDMSQLVRYDTSNAHDIRDAYGNDALMISCIHNQPKVVEYLLSISVQTFVTNDMKKTPLMLAIEYGKSLEIVKLLLNDTHVIQSVNNAIDKNGNTAILYACALHELEILKVLIQTMAEPLNINTQINSVTGDSMLHIAARNGCSINVMKYIINLFQTPSLFTVKNKNNQTFYHLCRNTEFIRYILLDNKYNAIYHLLNDIDETNCSPLMIWASEGRLDLIELIVSNNTNNNTVDYARVDNHGRNILHLLSIRLCKGLSYGDKSLDFIIEKFKTLVNIREWDNGNTPLHIAAETATILFIQQVLSFVKALIKYGSSMSAVNFKDEQPINICQISELIQCLDESHLKVDSTHSPLLKQGIHQFSWYITRFVIEYQSEEQQSQIHYIIKSGQVGKPESMRIVKRKFQDFILLKNELLYEMPEIFLPTFQNAYDPLLIDLKPPPLAWIDLTMTRLQSFMNWLQYHPILRSHDLVIAFVRSCSDLQQTFIRNNSFSRRKLLLEKISDTPLPNSVMTSTEEEYFLTYAQKMMMPLKDDYLKVLMAARHLLTVTRELENEMLMVAQNSVDLQKFVLIYPITMETIHVCANITGDRSYTSSWPQLIHAGQMTYDMVDGILLSLQRPLSLINQRNLLRESIEQQKEILRKSNYWHTIFSPKGKKKYIEQDKGKVIENMNELNHIDSQINQSHKMISDELAHFQNVHPKQMIGIIKQVSRAALAMEKHKLFILEQTLYKWSDNNT